MIKRFVKRCIDLFFDGSGKRKTQRMIAAWNACEPEYIRILRDPGTAVEDVRAFESAFEKRWVD